MKKRVAIFFVLLSLSMVPLISAHIFSEKTNLPFVESPAFLNIAAEISGLEQGQKFLNETIRYGHGRFNPIIKKGSDLNNYFRKLNMQDDYVYTILQFNDDADKNEIKDLEKAGAEEIGKYGENVFVYKFPKDVLETRSFDFIKWMDTPKIDSKIDRNLKGSLELNNSLIVKVSFYESYTDAELSKINRYGKFVNNDSWEPEEGNIYVLVAPRADDTSIHPAEEIAAFNFVKSVKLIDVKDKRKINLFEDQTLFYQDNTLFNQSHAIAPWQRSKEKTKDSSEKNPVKIISKKEIKDSEIKAKTKNNPKFTETLEYVKQLGYEDLNASVEVVYDNNVTAIFKGVYNSTDDSTNGLAWVIDLNNPDETLDKALLVEFVKEGKDVLIKMSDSSSGILVNLTDLSIQDSWGNHSCTYLDCLWYGTTWYYENNLDYAGACASACVTLSLSPPPVDFLGFGVCVTCLAGLGFEASIDCSETLGGDNCAYYPCQQDCDDSDGWGNWENYCFQGDAWRRKQYTNYQCSSTEPMEGSCQISSQNYGQEELLESCDYGCSAGSCTAEIACYSDNDCPADGWTGSSYCSGGDVWKTYRDYSCSNAGTSSSECVYSDNDQEKQDCMIGCSGGECEGSEGCGSTEELDWCDFYAEEHAWLEISDNQADTYTNGNAIICGENYCTTSEGFASKLDIDDCDNYLNESMLNKIQEVVLKWRNDDGESDCSNTDLYYYQLDEDDLDNAASNELDLTDQSNWGLVDEGAGGCNGGPESVTITSQYINDLTEDDDDEIVYSWWPENDQDWWEMDDPDNDIELEIEYCAPCDDDDGDGYYEKGCNQGTDCDDYNPYINPGANLYCDCNSGTGNGSTQGTAEVCDNIDNDCDGSIDDNLTMGCGEGICSGGVKSCSSGTWGTCSSNYLATNETCNGLDDDCDGSVDEAVADQECGTDVGECVKGTQSCSTGQWGTCGGTYVGPVNETCNGLDDNCNGIVDEDNVCGDYANVSLSSPGNGSLVVTNDFVLNCSAIDDEGLSNATLYHDFNGTFLENQTSELTGLSNSSAWAFTNISDGTYHWNCIVYDNDSHMSFGTQSPYTFTVNTTNMPPTTPTQILCDGQPCSDNETFSGLIEINCSGSEDLQQDNITYTIEAFSGFCYQETANESTACGGLDTGSYEYAPNETYIYINYSKPADSSDALWKVKHGYNETKYLSIPESCWAHDPDKLILRANVEDTPIQSTAECYDGTWNILSNSTSGVNGGSCEMYPPAQSILNFYDGNWETSIDWYGSSSLVCGYLTNSDSGPYYDFFYEEAIIWRSWEEIGNHSSDQTLSWNVTYLFSQTDIDLKCRAIDPDGSNGYSQYHDPAVNLTIGVPNDTSKVYIKNAQSAPVAWVGNLGNLVLSGGCTASPECIAPEGAFVISNSTDNTTAYIDLNGNLCIEKGSCLEKAGSCEIDKGFKIIGQNSAVAGYISFDGELCLTGKIFEGAIIG